LTPCSAKYRASVTTTGWIRSSVIVRPVTRPASRPTPRTIGTAIAPPRPCGASHTTYTQLVTTSSGEIERSNPRPMMDGALAIAARIIGAAIASWSEMPKLPLSLTSVATSTATISSAENA
jgi:hypothetical protein